MRSKKEWLGETLALSGVADLKTRLRPGSTLRVLAYHRVLDIGPEDAYPCDPELISATPADFHAQMAFARRHFDVLTFRDIIDALDRNMALPRRTLVISFDDGHIDNYTHAFPILRSLNVPATIFISTDYIGTRRMFWFDRVAYLLYCARPGAYRLATADFAFELGDVASRRHAAGVLLGALKKVPNERRLAIVEEAERTLPPPADAPPAPQTPAMNWDQVREMSAAGIEFASHTVTHPVLSQLDDAALEDELRRSREVIGSQTGREVRTIAYPIGKIGAYDDRVLEVSRKVGYTLGITYESGINPLAGFDRFTLRRLAVERYTTMGMFKSTLAFPGLFG